MPTVLMTFLRGEERAATPDNERPTFYESSAKLWNNKHRENSLYKGERTKNPTHITLFWEVFLFFLVTVHNRTVFWATWAARWGCGRATGHLPRQGRRDNHGTWPTRAPGAPAQPGSQRTSGEACLRDSRTQSLGAVNSKRVMKTQKEPHCHLTQASLSQ